MGDFQLHDGMPTNGDCMGKNEGKCHICGKVGFLSFEHIPPKRAYNSNRAWIHYFEDSLINDPIPWDFTENGKYLGGKRGQQSQRGVGDYTLCERCNNITGSWYANDFVHFSGEGYRLTYQRILQTNQWVTVELKDIFPLRVLKEIMAMFFSINTSLFAETHPDLQAFVLNRYRRYLSTQKYGVYIFILRGSIARYFGVAGILNFKPNDIRLLSELSFPPFGYVLELNPKERNKYCDITNFANIYTYNDQQSIKLKIPVYESNTPFPGDYRTKQQVWNEYLRGRLIQMQMEKKRKA